MGKGMTRWIVLFCFICMTSLGVWTQFGNWALLAHWIAWAIAITIIKVVETK